MRELVICLVFIPVASALVAQQDTAQGLVDALHSVAQVAIFSPNPRSFPPTHCFCASFGEFCSWLGTFRACACIPWLRWWCCLLTQSACPTLRMSPVVAGLAFFLLKASSLAAPA